jgi:pilus assembly protein CpaE
MEPGVISGRFGRKSERELYLDRMEQAMPWDELLTLLKQHDPAAKDDLSASRLPVLLRTYLAQQWFKLSDSAAEEALYESPVLRGFAKVDLDVAAAPDESAIRDFRRMLAARDLDKKIQAIVNSHLESGSQARDTVANGQRCVAADAYSSADAPLAEQKLSTAQNATSATPVVAEVLSVAIISPEMRHRSAATAAIGQCISGPIREFTSYPPNLDDVPQMLTRDFDVVIVDLDSDQEYALNLVTKICTNGLATVIVCSERTDPELLLRAMRAGAREFLALPFDREVMAKALERAAALRSAARPSQSREGRLLVFLSAKGGSGVTTLACNSAVSLAQDSRKKTLLIDLNLPLGDAAINLGIRADHSVLGALENFKRLDSSFLFSLLEQHGSGLFVLAAPSELAPSDVSDEAINKLLEVARQDFDYVIVDAGSKLDLQSTRVFDKSATIFLVAQAGVAELRNSNRLVGRLTIPGGPKIQVVLNRYDPRSLEITDEHIAKALTRPPDWKIPNNYQAVRRMQNTSVTLMQDDSEISQAIREMTQSVSGQPAVPAKRTGLSFFR